MKKLFLIAGIAIVALSSCSKDHTCTCTFLGVAQVYSYPETKKKEATTSCNAMELILKSYVEDANEKASVSCNLN